MLNRTKISLLKLLFIVLIGVPIWLWSRDVGRITGYAVGQLFGLLGYSLLSVQLFMGSRMRWLDRGVGLDRILRWHRYNGIMAFSILLLHPILIALPSLRRMSLLDFVGRWSIYYWVGLSAILLLIFQVVTSIYSEKLRLTYEQWRVLHLAGYAIVALGALHSFGLGSHINEEFPLYWWWLGMGALAVSGLVYRYGIRPRYFRWFTVNEVMRETEDVTSVRFGNQEKEGFDYVPGQFAFGIFESKKVRREEHHFTLSSSPTEPFLQFSVKALGDFTQELPKLKKGDRVRIDGPFGVFSHIGKTGPFVFLVGGIGITPVRSMIRYMVDTKNTTPTTLIYSAKTLSEMAFAQELNNLAKKYSWLKVINVLSQEKKAGFMHGRIDRTLLEKNVKNLANSDVFLVGPEPFLAAMKQLCREMGVAQTRVYTELFRLK